MKHTARTIFAFFAAAIMSYATSAALHPNKPAITDCKTQQEVINVLSDGSGTPTVLKCMGDIASFTGGLAAGLPFDSGICLDTGSRNVFSRTTNTDADLTKVVQEVDPGFSIGGHVSVFELQAVASGDQYLSFHYAYASSEFDQFSCYSDPFALLVSINGGEYENLARLDNGMPVSIKNLRAGRNKLQNNNGNQTYSVSSTEYFTYASKSSGGLWNGDIINGQNMTVDGITLEFCAEKAVKKGDTIKLKFVIADTGDANYDSFVFIKAGSLGFADIAGAPIATDPTDVSKAGFVCNWYEVSGAVKYLVDVSNDEGFTDLIRHDVETTDNHYRVDGTFPQDGEYYYRVRAVGESGIPSGYSNVIKVTIPTTEVAKPTVSPDGCEFTGSIVVTIENNHPKATLYYTTDGFNPTVYSTKIASGGTITLTTNTTVKAIAIYNGVSSPVETQTYSLVPPVMPPSAVTDVQATDGTHNNGVSVTWSAPASDVPVLAYEISRKGVSDASWTVLSSTLDVTTYFDSSAEPGKDYTYRVRAKNKAGWGYYGSDAGWCGVTLSVSPTSITCDYQAASQSVGVTANTAWKISSSSGCASATVSSSSAIQVSIAKNEDLSPRKGSVTVTAGAGTAHPATAVVTVNQGARPAKLEKLEIVEGATSLEGGESTSFRAIATFDDGTTKDVTTEATWTIPSGGKYGTVSNGNLTTFETEDTSAGLTVSASYSSSSYEPVTKSDTVSVAIGFTMSKLKPVTVTIYGDSTISIGETKPYTATVSYNNGTKSEKTVDSGMVWSVNPGMPAAKILKGVSAAMLTSYAAGKTLTVTATYTENGASASGTKNVTVPAAISIPVAVDVESPDGKKIYGGNFENFVTNVANGNVWYGQSAVTHDGIDAAQSGYVPGIGWNSMETVVTNAGTVSFWWKLATESSGDKLTFLVDGVEVYSICGETPWQEKAHEITAGLHTLKWVYAREGAVSPGLSAGYVDQIEWKLLDPPGAPEVNATDGVYSDRIVVTWTAPKGASGIKDYEVSRKADSDSEWTVVVPSGLDTSFTDYTVVPGEQYTYRVKAKNDAGDSEFGSDTGWRKPTLAVNPASLSFDYAASSQNVSVSSNAGWEISGTSGCADASVSSGSSITVSVAKNTELSPRTGTVTLTAAAGTAHPVSATVSVEQGKRPAKLVNLEIVGGETSLEGGEETTFSAVATFDDGSTKVVTAEASWTIPTGSEYGTVTKGKLVTEKTTETSAALKVRASYTNSDYEEVTLIAEVDVSIGFTMSLLAPVGVAIVGDPAIGVGETKPYSATVTYNNGAAVDKTLDLGMSWSVNPGTPSATVSKTVVAAMLSAFAEDTTLVLAATYTEGTVTVSDTKNVTVPAAITIPVAVDTQAPDGTKILDFEFTLSKSVNGNDWYGEGAVSHDFIDAAQSGRVFGEGYSRMETVVTNAGTVSFWWKVSSEPVSDILKFAMDGTVLAQISGENDWTHMSFEIGEGTHTLCWEYSKNKVGDEGLDAGFVDQISFVELDPPGTPVVTASDGASTNNVKVSWTKPASDREITGYEISRSEIGKDDWSVLAETVSMEYLDGTADAGIDYTYRVRAKNDAGYGEYGSDTGWKAISLSVDPMELSFSHTGDDAEISVSATASWSLSSDDGWLSFAGSVITADATETMDERTGSVTVTAETKYHSTNVVVSVVQGGIPPSYDLAFVEPDATWRTKMQLATNTLASAVYSPVSVFPAGAPLGISFGWINTTNSNTSIDAMPKIGFKLYKAGISEPVYEWVSSEGSAPSGGLAIGAKAWCGHLKCDILKVLLPGDYMLEAEIDPGHEFDKAFRDDNFAVFRFAILDKKLDANVDLFPADGGWKNVVFKEGGVFAQAPHVASRILNLGQSGVSAQFGPYVPMGGSFISTETTGGKGALDLVFLIDVTGSMGGCINGLKSNIKDFFTQLINGDADHAPVTDWRAKVIGYRDVTCDWSWYEDHGFTTDQDEFKSHIAACYASGGGDGPESLLDSVWRIAKETEFREGASKVVVAFTDAPYKSPMSYGETKDKNWGYQKAAEAAKEAGITFMLVACPYAQSDKLKAFAEEISGEGSYMYVTSLSSGATGSLNVEKLIDVAKVVSKSVTNIVEVVEPVLKLDTRGRGVLTFDWINNSTADTDNTFTFECDAVTNISLAAGTDEIPPAWQTVSLDLDEGWHHLAWSYGKLGYEGAVSDCGVVANLRWEPAKAVFVVSPNPMKADYLGAGIGKDSNHNPYGITNKTEWVDDAGNVTNTTYTYGARFNVVCSNCTWKVVDCDSWIKPIVSTGNKDGEMIVEIDENMSYEERKGVIAIERENYGIDGVYLETNIVKVTQAERPIVEGPVPQVLTVGVKPRWPWNDWVDIDFKVATTSDDQPVYIYFRGVNNEGGDVVNYHPRWKYLKYCEPKSAVPEIITVSTNATLVSSGNVFKCVECRQSGLYRISWRMGQEWNTKWTNAKYWGNNTDYGFHSPAFAVELTASNSCGKATLESKNVRVDLRQNTSTVLAQSGGAVLTGTEMIGHPTGLIDPVECDTTTLSNGWNCLDEFYTVVDDGQTINYLDIKDAAYTNRFDRACVINDAYIEGGVIETNTTWGTDKVHIIRDNVFVAPDAVLTIADGAVLKFCFCSRIFIIDSGKNTTSAEQFNIRVKGAYFTFAYDSSLPEANGDTLRVAGTGYIDQTAEWQDLDTWRIVSNNTSVQDGSNESSMKSQSNPNNISLAVKRVQFQQKNASGKYEPFRQRFYTRGETWGNLPKPTLSGNEFYGWFDGNPDTLTKENYMKSSNRININGCPYSDFRKSTYIYPLLHEQGWAENLWELADASGGTITISPSFGYYNGAKHTPGVASVVVNEAIVPSDNYHVIYPEGDFTSVGEHKVSVMFDTDYKNAPTGTYTIVLHPTDDGWIEFDSSKISFIDGNKNSTLYRPDLNSGDINFTVKLPDMGVVPSGDVTVNWLSEDLAKWPKIGNYRAVATFDSNKYTGPSITNTFTILHNEEYDYKAYSTAESAKNQWLEDKADRILYMGGPADNAILAYIRDLITNDTDMNAFVMTNFVVWTEEDIEAEDAAFGKFTEGMDSTELPLLAILSGNDMTRPLAKHSGIIEREELWTWLHEALELPEDASGASITCFPTLAYTGFEVNPGVQVFFADDPEPMDYRFYDLVFSESPVNVGTYTVKAKFKGKPDCNYIGETEAFATFEIVPAAFTQSMVKLDMDEYVYDGEPHKPSAIVLVDADYAVEYGSGDWTQSGTYQLIVSASGNYTGTVAKTFEIKKNTISGVTVELDTYKIEVTEDKVPLATAVKPTILSVKDAGKTYVLDTDYTISWGAGDYKNASTNTITATFKGNYSGTATAKFIIDVLPPPIKDLNPEEIEAGVEVSATDADEAVEKVVVSIPVDGKGDSPVADALATAGFTDSKAAKEKYDSYFEKTAVETDEGSGKWTVTATLKESVVLPEEMMLPDADEPSTVEELVLDAVLDDSSDAEIIAVPGLYYTLMGSSSLKGEDFEGTPVLSEGTTVILVKPAVADPTKVFYKVIVSPTPVDSLK